MIALASVWIDHTRCVGCEACISACPKNLIRIEKDLCGITARIDHPQRCVGCGSCALVCGVGAITVYED